MYWKITLCTFASAVVYSIVRYMEGKADKKGNIFIPTISQVIQPIGKRINYIRNAITKEKGKKK